ncbi:MAG: hypothetical protein ACYCO5_11945 [Acidobacteriaceae bacterium]
MRKSRKGHILLVGFAAFLSLAAAAQAATERAEGFVTQIDSATAFDVGTLHVTLNGQMAGSIQKRHMFWRTNDTWKWDVYPTWPGGFRRPKFVSLPWDARSLAIGDYVYLLGTIQTGGSFSAMQAMTFGVSGPKDLQGAALLEEQPELRRGKQGWIGTLWLDGYPISINPQTKMLAAPADTTIRYRYRGPAPRIQISAHLHSKNISTAFPASLLRPNTWVTYKAVRAPDHNITATHLVFWPNRVGTKERTYLARHAATIHEPDFAAHVPGTIQYPHEKPIEVLPSRAVQDYVSAVGMEMVPQYQKDLPDNDPTKIHFRFYAVRPFVATNKNFFMDTDGMLPYYRFMRRVVYNSPKPNAMLRDIVAMPNGLILMPDRALANLHNRAQLAAVLSFAIGSVLQKQGYLAWPLITAPHVKYINGIPPPTTDSDGIGAFWTMQNEQVVRVGLRQMLRAGYDLREAPFAWSAGLGKPSNSLLYKGDVAVKHAVEVPWYAGYSMNFLSHYYAGTDYSKLHKGESDYPKFLLELRRADPSLGPVRQQK